MTKKLQSEKIKPKRSFGADDDKNWQTLFNTQFQKLQSCGAISTLWMNGYSKLGLDNSKMPTTEVLTEKFKNYTGYRFIQTIESVIYEQIDWYSYITRYEMPISGFLRTPNELDYCDEPDNWHEIMGHIPFLIDKEYSDMYQSLAKLYIEAYKKNREDLLQKIDFVSGYIIELGLIKEESGLKAFGATLYSSSGELARAYRKENQFLFNEKSLLSEKGSYDRSSFQGKYYIVESLGQIKKITKKIQAEL